MTICRETSNVKRETCHRQDVAREASYVKRILLFARTSRDLREKRDGSDVSSSRVAPVAHVLLVSPTIHDRRFTHKSGESAIAAEALMNNAG